VLCDNRTQEWGTTRFISGEIREKKRGGSMERSMMCLSRKRVRAQFE
jgi:hypothetical protein